MTRIFRTIVMAALPAAILCAAASCTSCHKDNKLEVSFTVESDGESPNLFKLTADNQTPSSTYEWTADGSTWQGSTVTCHIGRKGLHNVTLRQKDGNRSGKCTKKIQVTQDSYPFLNGEELWWHDEFNGHALDTRSWNYDTGIGKWGNNEWENYTDSRDNVFLRDGKLVIRAIKTGEGQKIGDYTSGRLTTSGKKEISRGRVEVRAKLPGGNGIWPAIWFFGRKAHPYYSELDIMEYVGCDKNIIYGAVHTTATLDGSAEKVSMSRTVPDVETAFHTYGMEWSDKGIAYYLDEPSNVYLRYEPSDFSDPSIWPFDKELYLILNVAVGGDWGGMKGVDDSIFPCEMEVDYVRIFRKMRIGVDLGGTSIRAGLADKGTLLRKERLRCPSKGSCGEVLDAIEEVISRVMHPGVESVGIGVPSVVDTARGIVYNAANIPSWKEVPLKDIMQERLGLEVNVNNDSNCFTLGESLFGKCRDCSDIVGLTIGTGVGSGIIINGRLYEGRNAGAGEIGSLPYLGKDFESWCSTPFFTANGTTGAEAAEAAASGDAGAIALWNEYGVHLGELVKAILYIYDPEAIVIGGGLAVASGLYRDSLIRQLSSFAYPNSAASVRLLFADNTDMALLGAASLKDK